MAPRVIDRGIPRRNALVKASMAGLTLGFHLPLGDFSRKVLGNTNAYKISVNAFVNISPDNIVTIISPKTEMGQGTQTGVAVLIAEELEVDWRNVRVEHAPSLPQYRSAGRPGAPPSQSTGGSSSISGSFESLRKAGAAVRYMLRKAAAQRWGVSISEITTSKGYLYQSELKRKVSYGEVAEEASKIEPPEDPELKESSTWSLIGKSPPRIDTPSKVDGSAVFGTDIKVENMLIGAVKHVPVFGGQLISLDPGPALKVKGVVQVVSLNNAFIVLADNYWNAQKGLEAIKPEWDLGTNVSQNDEDIDSILQMGISNENEVGLQKGDVENAFEEAEKIVNADYEVPYLSHSPMEPMNATVFVQEDFTEVWAPVQVQTRTQQVVAEALGLSEENVMVYTPQLGGGFGRRLQPDFVVEAAVASKESGRPVKLIWSREEDTRHSFYRPRAKLKFQGALDSSGKPSAVDVYMSEDSAIASFTRGNPRMKSIVGRFASGWLTGEGYGVSNYRFSYFHPKLLVPIGAWRSVQYSHNGFFGESMIDEMANAAGADPLAFRSENTNNSRYKSVLDKIAEMSKWSNSMPPGHGLGVAMVESFGSIVAQVMHVSVQDKEIKVHKVWCVIDCGLAVHPENVKAQMESAVTYGLSAAFFGEINIRNGGVVQGNFDGYDMLRISQAPDIDTHIIDSGAKIGGAGEPGLPPIAAALTNALFSASGIRIRKLPLIKEGYFLV